MAAKAVAPLLEAGRGSKGRQRVRQQGTGGEACAKQSAPTGRWRGSCGQGIRLGHESNLAPLVIRLLAKSVGKFENRPSGTTVQMVRIRQTEAAKAAILAAKS
jgi:hypothetical protein